MKRQLFLLVACLLAAVFCFQNCQNTAASARFAESEAEEHSPSRAGDALRMWAMSRVFPDGKFCTEKYATALAEARLEAQLRGGGNQWEALGPKNIGGRTLCLAFHPQDTNVMFAGTASGGIWKTTSAGRGYSAWQRVETGFPLLGVSAIAINPLNPNELYAGTGEVYNVENSMPNVAVRLTRGTYGIGILKSADGGATWKKSLDWSYGDLRGVQDLKINPARPATVYAATTEGLYRTWDAGAHWHKIHAKRMAVDIELHPTDTSLIFVTHGSLGDTDVSGIYRSKNGGTSFSKLAGGLPATFTGKTLLSICASQPNTMLASVGNDLSQEGLYKSTDGGDNWLKISTQNVASYQGWYSHDVSIKPDAPDDALWCGIEMYRSTNGGAAWQKKSIWFKWFFGQVPVGGPEGPGDYVHADIHRVYHHPADPKKAYCATDGGVFVTYDGGNNWEGRNGSLQCTQFYANFGNSTTNPSLAIGGMQDNSTAIFTGDDAWTRVLGGDGECAGIDPTNDQIMYGSYQYLAMSKSEDGGQNFFNISPPSTTGACFNGPFEIVPSAPEQLYAGAASLWRSFDGGISWDDAHGSPVNGGNGILSIAVCPSDPERIFLSTAPTQNDDIQVFASKDGGQTLTKMTGLPNRMCMDIAFHPTDPNTAYAVFSGFGSDPVWRTTTGGATWQPISEGLPDLPTNTILLDPLCPKNIYIGNDIGVWLSRDAGATWEIYSADAPQAMLVMHLSISAEGPTGRKLRAATHGLGVWQTDMAACTSATGEPDFASLVSWKNYPNPAAAATTFALDLPEKTTGLRLRFFDASGREMRLAAAAILPKNLPAGQHEFRAEIADWPAGIYGATLEGKLAASGRAWRKTLIFSKM